MDRIPVGPTVLLAACLACTLPAMAGEDGAVSAAFESARPLDAAELESSRATAQLHVDRIQINDQDLTAELNGNVATGNQTGNNSVGAGVFSDSAGFMTTIQNTGNNVIIQNSTIISVALEP